MGSKTKKLITILAILGIGVSAYLTYIKISINAFSCNFGQCGVVQDSKHSELFGIPVAMFGLAFYAALLTLTWSKFKKVAQAWALWGLIFSSYLTILELFVLKAICGWCVISFVIIILINLLIFEKDTNDLSSGRPRRI